MSMLTHEKMHRSNGKKGCLKVAHDTLSDEGWLYMTEADLKKLKG